MTFFFFQAEDGIRDYKVTGVQTCALPIFQHPARLGAVVALQALELARLPERRARRADAVQRALLDEALRGLGDERGAAGAERSEERRVGKECRCRRRMDQQNKM